LCLKGLPPHPQLLLLLLLLLLLVLQLHLCNGCQDNVQPVSPYVMQHFVDYVIQGLTLTLC
jgi:hypothetical protein